MTKDSDFTTLSLVDGAPSKVIWIALGNCSTSEIEDALRSQAAAIEAFGSTGDATYLILR